MQLLPALLALPLSALLLASSAQAEVHESLDYNAYEVRVGLQGSMVLPRLLPKYEAMGDAYDRQTRHGRTQGAWLTD